MSSLAKFLEGGAFGILNDIVSTFHSDDGYAIPNRFEVLILPPPKNAGGSITNLFSGSERKSDARAISLRCESISLPGRSLNTEEDTNIYGPSREVVKGATYAGEVAMTFQASSGLDERVFFEEWQKQAFDETSWNVGYYNDFVSRVEIYLLDKQDQRRYGIKLHEAYPKEIVATELNQGTRGDIIKNSVNFQYRYWTTLDIQRQAPNLGDKIFSTIVNTVERNISANIPKVLTRL